MTLYTNLDASQLKRSKQEANQKASLIYKAGMPFYCANLDECKGDIAALVEVLLIINTPIKKPNGEIIRDTSNVGKMLISANEHQLAIVTYSVSEKLNAEDWIDPILYKYNAVENIYDINNEEIKCGIIRNDPSMDIYVFKLRDELISEQYERLKSMHLIEEKEDDDEILFGDDVFD